MPRAKEDTGNGKPAPAETGSEALTSTERAFSGRLIQVDVDSVILPGGRAARREVVNHRGAVAVLALEGGKVLLERQYRHTARKVLWEVPAGTLEEGEAPEACARRELEEETGFRASTVQKLVQFYVAPGYSREIIHVFLAGGLEAGTRNLDDDERLEWEFVPLAEAIKMVEDNEIEDSKTIISILFYMRFVKKGNPP